MTPRTSPRDGERPTRDGHDVELAYRALRNSILRGEIPAGTTMSQVQLAKRLGLSRTPLREAVRFLQHEGLIDAEANRRLRVASLTADDVEQLYVMRVALETTAVRMTVPDFRATDIAEMKGLMAQMDHFAEEHDFIEFERPHRRFHALLVSGGGSRLAGAISELSDHAERYRRAHLDTGPAAYALTMDEHRDILAAAAVRDAQDTATRLVAQYWRTATSVINALDPDYEPARLQLAVEMVQRAGKA
jgi:DNA-binding GntR family transcriptional regulator